MSVVFTGLSKTQCDVFLQMAMPDAKAIYAPAGDVLANNKSDNFSQIVWLYQAPWSISHICTNAEMEQNAHQLLNSWLTIHRTLLRKRRSLGKKLMIVDVENTHPTQLMETLGLPHDPGLSLGQKPSAVDAVLAQTFASSAPELWDVYEALSAFAWKGHAGTYAEEGRRIDAVDLMQILLDGQAYSLLKKTEEELRKANALQSAKNTELLQEIERLNALIQDLESNHEAAKGQLEYQIADVQQAALQKQNALESSLQQLSDAYTQDLGIKNSLISQLKATLAASTERQTTLEIELSKAHKTALQHKENFQEKRRQLEQEFQQKLAAKEVLIEQLNAALHAQSDELSRSNRETNDLLMAFHDLQEQAAAAIVERTELENSFKENRISMERARMLICRMITAQTKVVATQDSAPAKENEVLKPAPTSKRNVARKSSRRAKTEATI